MYHNIVRRPGEILKSNNFLNNDKLENSELNPYSQVQAVLCLHGSLTTQFSKYHGFSRTENPRYVSK